MLLTGEEIDARAKHLRLLLFDVDGVLTDGTISLTGAGDERKSFSIRDGAAIIWAQRAGLEIGLVSGRSSNATARRAAELNIPTVIQGELNKRHAFLQVAAKQGLQAEQIAYMGDDLLDLPVLQIAGLSAAPADACDDVLQRVHYVTRAAGGRGAVREFIELVLRGAGQWDAVVQRHLRQGT
jgi:3-deoxy-D-manno-octulosonate 8-phosphate phosphatase (KDO 8-P phosphatase)